MENHFPEGCTPMDSCCCHSRSTDHQQLCKPQKSHIFSTWKPSTLHIFGDIALRFYNTGRK